MRVPDPVTPAELRLAGLLFVLTLAGLAVRIGGGLSPRVERWLEEGITPPPDTVAAPSGEAPDRAAPPPVAAGEDSTSGPAGSAVPPSGESAGVDPNAADLGDLLTLPGVGPVLAGRILEDRARNGPYRGPEDLLRVKGIGPATLARIRDRLVWPAAP